MSVKECRSISRSLSPSVPLLCCTARSVALLDSVRARRTATTCWPSTLLGCLSCSSGMRAGSWPADAQQPTMGGYQLAHTHSKVGPWGPPCACRARPKVQACERRRWWGHRVRAARLASCGFDAACHVPCLPVSLVDLTCVAPFAACRSASARSCACAWVALTCLSFLFLYGHCVRIQASLPAYLCWRGRASCAAPAWPGGPAAAPGPRPPAPAPSRT